MSKPDIQYFDRSGTWAKPHGAVRADVVLQGAGGGAAAGGYLSGEDGEISVRSIPASELPDQVAVVIGTGGRPGGRDGYALIITHLQEGEAAEDVMAEITRLRDACRTLGKIVTWQARSIRAAVIEGQQNGAKAAMQWIINSLPDVDDSDPADQWDGTETAAQWLDRVEAADRAAAEASE